MAAELQQTRFQPLTCIRQTGTSRTPDGTTIYRFVAQVSQDLPVVTITLQVTPSAALSIEALFDERARVEGPDEGDHRNEGEQLALLPLQRGSEPTR
jgi:hypothetical protein